MSDDLKTSLLELAVNELPRTFVRDIMRVLPLVYSEAHARTHQDPAWDKSEAHDLCGHVRRALFESQFRKLATASGMTAKPFRNPKKTSYYTLVRAGRLVVTQSALQHEWQMARPAIFRVQHAAVNHILSNPLLTGLDLDPPNLCDPGEIYSILFHGPRVGNPGELGFAVLGFPASGSHRTLYRFPLDLIAKAQAGHVTPDSIMQDNVRPRFKKKRDVGSE